jgi:(1->4)-alpha-D-glucan 1-alpha-D-glucosylmutase
VAYYGALNSLAQVLLKITSPGVPDFYQGTELWDFSLVDPDNRRAVDFPQRVRHLKELKRKKSKKPGALASQLLSNWEDGRLKLLVICQALNFRKNNLKLFLEGEYLPLTPAGDRRQEVVAFARRHGKDWALAAVGRFFTRIAPFGEPPTGERGWGNRTLELPRPAPSRWLNVLTGETLEASGPQRAKTLALPRIFQSLPVALLWGTAR